MWLVASKRIVTCCTHYHLIVNSKVKYCTVESCIFHKIGKLFKIRMNYLKNNFLAYSRENHMETLKEYTMKRFYCTVMAHGGRLVELMPQELSVSTQP